MPTPKEKMIRHIKKNSISTSDFLNATPVISDTSNKGIREMARLIDEEIVLEIGKI